jgi:hypothetical protein
MITEGIFFKIPLFIQGIFSEIHLRRHFFYKNFYELRAFLILIITESIFLKIRHSLWIFSENHIEGFVKEIYEVRTFS